MTGRALVTGAAGFIGSQLCEALVAQGVHVVGVDALTDYYEPARKLGNVAGLVENRSFELVRADLSEVDLDPLLAGVDVVYHLAAQPGVRHSWSTGFPDYVRANVLATQQLLEACRDRPALRRIVAASSSSVYGDDPVFPTSEAELPHPHSPYGVTKLAAEHLCGLYAANWAVPTTSLRFFTVYGPRQRPDMAIHRFVEAGLDGRPIEVYGDGEQRRDFTFVGDIVAACIAAGRTDVAPGAVFNIAGGTDVSVNELLAMVGAEVGAELDVRRMAVQAGDVRRTKGDISRAIAALDWSPAVSLAQGLRAQVGWHRLIRDAGATAPVS